MKCTKCGREVKEGALFCSHCGCRLDGKVACKKCGAMNDKESVYCIACGERLDGKVVCKKCGETNDDGSVYCIACGAAMSETEKVEKGGSGIAMKVGKICRTISSVTLMIGVLFSMLFVWFIRVRIIPNSTVGREMDIYYFFGEAWKELDAMTTTSLAAGVTVSDDIFSLVKTETIIYNILGLILCAAILIGVTAFGIKSIIDYLSALVNRKEDKSEKSALRCLFCFLGGAILFLGFTGITTMSNGVENGTRITGTTTAGFVLVWIVLAIKLICKLIAKAPELGKKENTSNLIFSTVGLIFSIVLICLVQNAVVTAALRVPTGTTPTTTDIDAGFFTFVTWGVNRNGLLALANPLTAAYTNSLAAIGALNIYSIIGQLALFAFVALAVWLLGVNMRKVEGEQKTMLKLILSSSLVFLSIIMLVFSILSCNAMQDLITPTVAAGTTPTTILEGGYGIAICCIVFSVLSLVVEVVRIYLEKMKAQESV